MQLAHSPSSLEKGTASIFSVMDGSVDGQRELMAVSTPVRSVAGPTLAAHAIRTGLVDEYHLLVVPTMIGGGTRVLPSNVRIRLDLLDERRFADGMVYLRYHAWA